MPSEKERYSDLDVAKWFLSKQSMSPKKLQKLLYYAYSWVLTLTNDSADDIENKLFENNFEAWVHGPVLRDIYNEYREYGYRKIPQTNCGITFSDDINDILRQVWEVYGNYTADELESLTHQESPWKNARKGLSPVEASDKPILDKDIFNCYGRMAS